MSTTTISVISTRVIKEGTSAQGRPWTLYEVTAVDRNGAPIEHQLKTFDNLPQGTVDVELERQEHPQYGVSYMLRRAGQRQGGGNGGLGKSVDELRSRLDALEARVGKLESPINPPTPVAPDPAGASFTDPDDIPF